ncbi:disulfide-bond oxidoreductase YghU [Candidatus Phycosocius bacilliformis]|uniref:Disulfide-bond oxidoreductase YghU n=1 Tax=Candidatus Phycosocius bacilliformis TaxID=1445552 RepID=A0A2P2EB68_9PROT|nr:glutathione S-transferase family protein [Candidatus Phycosocius bacilliformis]GBF58316.1 disulfide-bond oxidoreductase YghU [Candidatus Phycosocius bacilliformis]
MILNIEKGRSGMEIYGDDRSGNCLKVRWTSDLLGLPYVWHEVLALTGQTAEPGFRALNPFGEVPVVRLADGNTLAQSNAIILYLAEGSRLIPQDRFLRAKMFEWLFWEQYSHEPVIAVRRAKVHLLGLSEAEIDPSLLPRGAKVLTRMQEHLSQHAFFVGADLTLADIALLPYTRFADQGGFELMRYPAIQRWIKRCESILDLPALA